MNIHKALHPRDDGDRLYVPRKEGGRGLASIEDSVDISIQRLEKHERGLITAIRNNTDNTIVNIMTKTRMTNKQHLTRQNLDLAKKRKH